MNEMPSKVSPGRLQGSTWCTQWQLLMWKHGLSSRRRWKSTAGQLLTPVLVVLMLIGLQKASDIVLNKHGETLRTAEPPYSAELVQAQHVCLRRRVPSNHAH